MERSWRPGQRCRRRPCTAHGAQPCHSWWERFGRRGGAQRAVRTLQRGLAQQAHPRRSSGGNNSGRSQGGGGTCTANWPRLNGCLMSSKRLTWRPWLWPQRAAVAAIVLWAARLCRRRRRWSRVSRRLRASRPISGIEGGTLAQILCLLVRLCKPRFPAQQPLACPAAPGALFWIFLQCYLDAPVLSLRAFPIQHLSGVSLHQTVTKSSPFNLKRCATVQGYFHPPHLAAALCRCSRGVFCLHARSHGLPRGLAHARRPGQGPGVYFWQLGQLRRTLGLHELY